ncbi:hypothetical protein B0H67DRAFT_300573 [Lasiosphaeris hirsuta]|uniref:Uncharacterized protein n=1 Tax=Lasiosphaeris hirsuta TaxID=260670 RepID=A0AA40A9I5_9PEZI|nr:hypothetical protein B0H67DRAFT_300573 [Lasiosphaeris hirsuta]
MPPHHTTPAKAHLIGAAHFLESYHIPFFKADLFREFGFSKTRGWQVLHDGLDRRRPLVETRGRKPIISAEDLDKMEVIIW